jgi:hypothetical protein
MTLTPLRSARVYRLQRRRRRRNPLRSLQLFLRRRAG